MTFSVDALLRELTRLPHRGAATPNEAEAADLLAHYLTDLGATVRQEPFWTPKTYVTVVYWLIGGLLLGLATLPWGRWLSVAVVWAFVAMAWLYFNWRYAPVTRFPFQHTAYNVVGRWPATNGPARCQVLLMAHYDTAPVSALYGSGQGTFRASLIVSLGLMALAAGLATAEVALQLSGAATGLPAAGAPAAGLPATTLAYVRYGLMLYFVGQAALGTVGYWLHGYTNGASDNATGVAAALATAHRLRPVLTDTDLSVVLTSAEEAGMLGAYHYVQRHHPEWPAATTFVVNFDTLGAGQLVVVEQTGTVEIIRYDNELLSTARDLLDTDDFRHRARVGRWHTADFDSVWFQRAGIPAITLCAQDPQGRMPRIHQRSDTLDAVDPAPLHAAVDLAEAIVRRQCGT